MAWRRFAVLALTLIAGLVVLASPASAAAKCKPGHHVLARKRGHAVIWATVTRHGRRSTDRLYICVSPHGRTHLLGKEPGSASPSVANLQVAGHFVGFVMTTASPFYVGPYKTFLSGTDLYVFDAAAGRIDIRDSAGCTGSTCSLTPELTKYVLAPNGWVAEQYQLFQASGSYINELVATNAPGATSSSRQSVPLDFDPAISGVTLSGDTVRWTGHLSGAASAVLAPSLVPSSAPQAISACQLLTTNDVSSLLGAASSSTSSSGCDYSSQTNPSETLALSTKTGLSSQQVSSDASALQNSGNAFPIFGYGYGYSIYLGTTTVSGVTHEQLMFFSASNGSEMSLDLTASGGTAAEHLPWLANVAFDRLFGVPIQRAN